MSIDLGDVQEVLYDFAEDALGIGRDRRMFPVMLHRPYVLMFVPSREDAALFLTSVLDVNPDIHFEVAASLGGIMSCLLGMGQDQASSDGELPDLLVICGRTLTMGEDAFIREIRKSPRWKTIAMAVLTDNGDPRFARTVDELGVVMFMRKPGSWSGYLRFARELDRYLCSAAISKSMTPPAGTPIVHLDGTLPGRDATSRP